jgi:hypothetical protein
VRIASPVLSPPARSRSSWRVSAYQQIAGCEKSLQHSHFSSLFPTGSLGVTSVASGVAPVRRAAVLEPEDRRSRIRWYVLDAGCVDRLLCSGGHEDFDRVVAVADAALVERALDTRVRLFFPQAQSSARSEVPEGPLRRANEAW